MPPRFRGVSRAARALPLLLLTTCNDSNNPIAPSTTEIPPPPPPLLADVTTGPQTLIGAGNIARCDRTNDEATGLLLDNYPTATVYTTGDNTNGNASLTNFNNCYGPSWGRNKGRTRPAVGQNEYKQAGASGFYTYFKPNGGDSLKYYYSYDLGGWHIMVLNDEITMTAGSPQELWLRNELANNTKKCTLAYWNHPRFTAVGTNNLASVKPLWDALYAYNADIVVNGHPQIYERFAPQSPTAVADSLGIREFIVGTGGINLQNPVNIRANSQVRQGTTYGVLKFTLDTTSYAWEFVPVPGGTFTDTGTGTCHTRAGVASIDVTPTSATLNPGSTVQLTATPRDANGTPLTGRVVTWSSSDTTVAGVSSTGLVTAKAVGGPVTITATSEGKSASAAITVSPVPIATIDLVPASATIQTGATQQFTATPKDANGNALTGRTITWATSDANVATINASGLATGVAAGGPITITASSEGQSATASLTVIPIPVASVTVSPTTASVVVGATQQLTATPKDANGNPLTGRTITWTSSDATIATVDANGLVTGNAIGGPVTITATSEGKSATAAITVTPVPVASVDVSPPTASMLIGGTAQLSATPKDANGNPLTGRTVTWTTGNSNIATVDANGLVTGTGAGTVTITATSEGKSGTASVTVALVPVATVDVSPSSATIQVGATAQLSATLKDGNGNTLTGRTITWATSDANIATVDANGLVTAQAVGGPITITATSEGKSATAAITVIPVPVASVVVAPATATIAVNATVQLTATTKDANGNTLTGR
ncbi:MAG TPA: Ig-like domain-containing protein, partial [Gemmatimonadales bacterium]|nr:Ig-like domain-containing protein [Gemmatimonadales bacterium]